MTDFFASRHSDVYIHCEDYTSHNAPLPCRDAHSDAVNWSSASSFVSNSILSFALVSVSVCPCLQMCPSVHVLHVCASVSMTTLKQGQIETFFTQSQHAVPYACCYAADFMLLLHVSLHIQLDIHTIYTDTLCINTCKQTIHSSCMPKVAVAASAGCLHS